MKRWLIRSGRVCSTRTKRASGAKECQPWRCAIDLQTRESEIRMVNGEGAVVFERRIATWDC